MNQSRPDSRPDLWLALALLAPSLAASGEMVRASAQEVAARIIEERPLGTWTIALKDGRGRAYRGTMVVARKDGPAVEGFIRWTDGRVGLEVIRGRYRAATRTLELDGIEWRGRASSPLGSYDAVLSEDGREWVQGKVAFTRGAAPVGSFTGLWKDDTAAIPDEIASSLEPLEGLPLLYSHLSAGYVLGGVTVRRRRDPSTLETLSRSGEGDARRLARLRLGLDREREEFERKVASTLTPGQVQADMFAGLMGGRSLIDDGGAVQKTQQRITNNADTAVEALKVEKQIRSILDGFLASRAATPPIEEKGLPLSYRVESKQDVVVAIENRTGRTLRDCVVITEARVDVAKINQAKLRKDQGDLPAYAFMALLDVDPGVRASTKQLEESRWDYERSDKGSTIFVREWKPGVRLETGLLPIRAAMYSESTHLSIWAADGHLRTNLSHDRIAEAVNRAFPPNRKGR